MPFDSPEQTIRRIEAAVLPPIRCTVRRLADLDVAVFARFAACPPTWVSAIDLAVIRTVVRALAGDPRALDWISTQLDGASLLRSRQ